MATQEQLQKLESAILCALAPGADPRKQQALQLCQQFKQSPNAWRSCVQLFATSKDDSVRFFTLQTLQHVLKTNAVSAENRAALRNALLNWIKTATKLYAALPIYIKNKLAIVFVLLIKADLLSSWSKAFSDLQVLLSLGESPMHLWIRILYYIDEEVVNPTQASREELAYYSRFKDHMRATILPGLVTTWFKLLEFCLPKDAAGTAGSAAAPGGASMKQHQQQLAPVAKSCLKTMSVYIPWIDIAFSANPRFLGLLARFASDPITCHATLMCLQSLIEKGMPPMQKLQLLESVNLRGFFTANRIPVAKPQIAAHAARFFCSFGFVALGLFGRKVKDEVAPRIASARRLLSEAIQLGLPFLNYGDARGVSIASVTKEILPFFKDALKLSRDEAWIAKFDNQVLHAVFKCYRFAPNHDFSHPEDVHADFFDFRRDLQQVFQAQAVSRCSTVVAWLSSAIVPNLRKLAGLPFYDAEALLELMAHFPPRAVTSSPDFQRLVVLLCQSDISGHAHHAVNLANIEVLLRYRAIITKSPPAIRAVFSALLGPRGMKHPRYKGVRSRSCYCMRKLLRAMQPDALGGYAQTIIKVLGPIVGSGDWEERDYMSIFEMIGLLASSQSTADPANGGKNNQLAVMDAILTPMMQELSRRLASAQANAVGGGGFSPAQAAWAARTLMAVSHFAKGFPNTTISEPSSASLVAVGADTEEKGRAAVAGRLLDFFNLAARTLAENASVEDIRRQVTTLAHTLLERTGTACLAPLCKILAALLGRAPSVAGSGAAQPQPGAAVGNGPDTTEVLQLLHDSTLKLGSAFAPYLEANIVGIARWVRTSLAQFDDVGHAKIAFRAFSVLIGGIVDRHIWPIFASERNGPHFVAVLEVLLSMLVRFVDLGRDILKTLTQFARAIYGAAQGQPVQRSRTSSSGTSRFAVPSVVAVHM
eukprot:INCI15506.2.p1 GENE.INCI15506.2~~INCI15506.2.p1  ORF type:complete len:934 (-),score=144.17 INCI15506.2:1246-4047(-)